MLNIFNIFHRKKETRDERYDRYGDRYGIRPDGFFRQDIDKLSPETFLLSGEGRPE